MRFGTGPATGIHTWTGRFIAQLPDPTDLCAALEALRVVEFSGSVEGLPIGAAAVIEDAAERYATEGRRNT
jgi:hypothetical protein